MRGSGASGSLGGGSQDLDRRDQSSGLQSAAALYFQVAGKKRVAPVIHAELVGVRVKAEVSFQPLASDPEVEECLGGSVNISDCNP